MAKVGLFSIDETDVQCSSPDPSDLVSGNPEFRMWTAEIAGDGVSAGVWESSQGKWRFTAPHWEYFHILYGVSIVTEAGGRAYTLNAGDSLVLRPGFEGTWEVIETTRKRFVIKE